MIAQRPAGAAPAIQAGAEDLPFEDDGFDAPMAMITLHHWEDAGAGIAEMLRVARDRVVVLTFEATLGDFWFRDYFPRAFEIHAAFMPPLEDLAAMLGDPLVEVVPIPRRCTDGFFLALWDRPEMHLDPAVRRASTIWHEMEPELAERGLGALRADLESGRWDERHGRLRDDTAELDLGLRLLVAEPGR
jgi:SAM-dependent methyltransferase